MNHNSLVVCLIVIFAREIISEEQFEGTCWCMGPDDVCDGKIHENVCLPILHSEGHCCTNGTVMETK